MTRTEAREITMQLLYEMDASKVLQGTNADAEIDRLTQTRLSGNHIARAAGILKGIAQNIDEIDDEINRNSSKWKTNRMPKVDLAIMRLAIGESRFNDDTAAPVIVNEAVNLAKKYSTDNSYKFIHGVLGAVFK